MNVGYGLNKQRLINKIFPKRRVSKAKQKQPKNRTSPHGFLSFSFIHKHFTNLIFKSRYYRRDHNIDHLDFRKIPAKIARSFSTKKFSETFPSTLHDQRLGSKSNRLRRR